MPDGERSRPVHEPATSRPISQSPHLRDVLNLIKSASDWVAEAMDAWTDDNYTKVAVTAPLAVEHLGKAMLWQKNPALVVPLSSEAEASLVKLTTNPSLTDPKLRTIGLKLLFSRLEAVIGTLPIPAVRRTRMVEIRNGAMHVAASKTSRNVLIDALTICNTLLEHLAYPPDEFYGDHRWNVSELVEAGRSEIQHRVAAKLARARKHLTILEERLGDTLFEETTKRLEEDAAYDLDDGDQWAVDWECPECGCRGRMTGLIDLSPRIHPHFDPDDPLDNPYSSKWDITMHPTGFSCNVCRLSLGGAEELAAARMPSLEIELSPTDLGPDFDPARVAEHLYGIND